MGKVKCYHHTGFKPDTIFNRIPEHQRLWTNRFFLRELFGVLAFLMFIIYLVWGIFLR